jgi:protoporphyrinogen oxidase
MNKIAIIGGGLSGLTVAHLLKNKYNVKIFEKANRPGGLIKCERVQGSLYHTCGGHVFNSKRQDVLDWFWSFFNKEKEFIKAERNASIFMNDGLKIPYPIENHGYLLNEETKKGFINDLVKIAQNKNSDGNNLEDFLRNRFGETLFNEYFKPYNEKIWRSSLKEIPLEWLEGKLPMPSVEEIIYNNISHINEKSFVHSSFWYEKNNGSQFIIDKLSEGLDIICNSKIDNIQKKGEFWYINKEQFDKVIYCGNIKYLPIGVNGVDIAKYTNEINKLKYHGTTTVFCEIEKNPFSWIYLPSPSYEAHRIICTGNFSPSNNEGNKLTATIEFTDYISKEDILQNLSKMPLAPKYLTHTFNKYSYPIQDKNTRGMILNLKKQLQETNFYMTGRFSDWEYYNMDAAIGAAIDTVKNNIN